MKQSPDNSHSVICWIIAAFLIVASAIAWAFHIRHWIGWVVLGCLGLCPAVVIAFALHLTKNDEQLKGCPENDAMPVSVTKWWKCDQCKSFFNERREVILSWPFNSPEPRSHGKCPDCFQKAKARIAVLAKLEHHFATKTKTANLRGN